MQFFKAARRDTPYLTGLIFIAVSTTLFLFVPLADDASFPLFFIHFGLTASYMICMAAGGRFRRSRRGASLLPCLLVLALVACFALNRVLRLFETSATWWCVFLVVSCANLLLFPFFETLPAAGRRVLCFVAGISIVGYLYLAIYLTPYYALSLLALPVLLLSVHTFVPALIVGNLIVVVQRAGKGCLRFFMAGGLSALGFVTVFTICWCALVHNINREYRRADAADAEGVPAWVRVSQTAFPGWMTERVLKMDLVYSSARDNWSDLFWRVPSRGFSEELKHDPLVMIGSVFSGEVALDDKEKISVLKAMYDARYQAEDRLWGGEGLVTERVDTKVRLWPQYRLSYTEQTLQVSNLKSAWTNEALYTFHLPEGGVVTSLSLWIDGKEVKSVLTSQAKADSAYQAIVGYERRDPSVVHWREGNRVVVRVFPVDKGKSRLFKIGVTAPLECPGGQMRYTPLYFEGPDARGADEAIALDVDGNPESIKASPVFSQLGRSHFTYTGTYKNDWDVQLSNNVSQAAGFRWGGFEYKIVPQTAMQEPATITDVYLDINRAWTREECNLAYDRVKGLDVWAMLDGDRIRVDEAGKDALFTRLRRQQFTLFPFQLVTGNDGALVVTKGPGTGPNLGDLEGSRFYRHLSAAFKDGKRANVYCIDGGLSPYLAGLKEYRAFRYRQGDLQHIPLQSIPAIVENDGRADIDQAMVSITRTPTTDTTVSGAPDHLMRLFAYNDILRKSGAGLFDGPVASGDILREAQEAYVVSPVCSLIVLETQEDYKRYGIETAKNSLDNASLNAKGSVPEPGTWALIAVVALVLLYAFRSNLRLKTL